MRSQDEEDGSGVPRAQVANSPVPLHRRPGLRKLVGVVAVVGACFGGWKLLKLATRSDENKRLEARQDKARARIGSGLDRLFEKQLDEDTKTVELRAKLEVASGLDGYDSASDCAKGLQGAFEEALGPDVVAVSTYTMHADPDLLLELTGTISPNGHSFQLPNSRAEYSGIKLAADLKLIGKTVHADVEPAADIEFEYTRYTYSMDGISAHEVAGGILQGTCKQAGYVLLEHLTKWERPEPPPPADPIKDCERGFHCRESADAIVESDPAKAEKLYATACEHDDEDACVRLALVALESPGRTDRALARVALEMACQRDLAHACAGAAQVSLIPDEDGKPPSAYQRREALPFALRACDLGFRDACALAVPLVKNTPYAEAGPLLGGAASVASKQLGTLFALRWGQWTKMDRGQPTLWGTKRPSKLPEGAVVREFSAGTLPRGIVPPAGVETVYALALDGGHGGYDAPCDHCNPSGGGGSIYSMRSLDCVCAVTPP